MACGFVVLVVCLLSPVHAQDSASIDLAYRFLEATMDEYAGKLIVVAEPEQAQFFPAVIGDGRAITLDARASQNPHSGASNFAIRVEPQRAGSAGWAGVYFLFPEDNWGAAAGRDLGGATRLGFRARADRRMSVQFLSGGLNRDRAGGPHRDSYGPVGGHETIIDGEWRRHEIDLTGQDLASVIGAFAVVARWAKDDAAYAIELDDVVIERPGHDPPRLLQSYPPSDCTQDEAPNSAHVYDQALVMLAFLARGRPGDLKRATALADALVLAQANDRTFKDGRLRNAYASGELIDPARGTARLPGRWSETEKAFHEDSYAVGSHTGNMAWAALALAQAGPSYRAAAERLAHWIVTHTKVDDSLGGFSGGYEGFETVAGKPDGQEKLLYRSTEHNIDLVALFDLLDWPAEREHARRFVEAMRSDDGGPHLWTGTQEGTAEPNRSPIPLDVQSWAVLAMGRADAYRDVLDWALTSCRAGSIEAAFDFDCRDGDGAWWEGTAQMAAALRWSGSEDRAAVTLSRLREAQSRNGAIPAASRCGLTTGFMRQWGPKHARETKAWRYSDAPHIGATAWYLLAAQGRNPFARAPARP